MLAVPDPALRSTRPVPLLGMLLPRGPLPRRAVALLVVLVIHALLVAVLLLLNPERAPPPATEPKVFVLVPTPEPAPAPKPAPRQAPIAPNKRPASAATAPAPPVPVRPEPPPEPKLFDKQLFDAIDIAKLPNQRALTPPGVGDTEGTAADSQATYGPGEGPGGERLYNAEWQREPTDAELDFYLPRGRPAGGWAIIACRTIERFRVEDCREIGESPPGSRLASGVREAAWQFRVLPPRIGGRPMVGAWVRIRIEFTEKE